MKIALTIAGSDSGGGAGIQADLKTFQALGVFGTSAISAITVQNTRKVYAVHLVPSNILKEQITCLFADMHISAVKIGMVGGEDQIGAVAEALEPVILPPVVLDPVMISKSGYSLLNENAREKLVNCLFPFAEVVTPNIHEAEVLVGRKIQTIEEMEKAAGDILSLGAKKVVVKGGHLGGEESVDVIHDGKSIKRISGPRINTRNTHGTGCTFSSAIAANLAKGAEFEQAVEKAKEYISGAISHSLSIGKGYGPTHHFYAYYPE